MAAAGVLALEVFQDQADLAVAAAVETAQLLVVLVDTLAVVAQVQAAALVDRELWFCAGLRGIEMGSAVREFWIASNVVDQSAFLLTCLPLLVSQTPRLIRGLE